MVKINFELKRDSEGGLNWVTDCPEYATIKVGSNECVRCMYFGAIYPKNYVVSCKRPEKTVFLASPTLFG
jgi:hypothetical protein